MANTIYPCSACNGTGFTPFYLKRPDGFYEKVYEVCRSCAGTGNIVESDTPFLDRMRSLADNSGAE